LELARRDGGSLLDLSDLGLRTLPQEVADLTQVEELDASGNRLTEFPDAVLELAGLRSLDLGNNRIGEVPVRITRLSRLETLDLSENRLRSLPEGLAKLGHLRSLGLFRNRIACLPDHACECTSMATLDIGGNRLQTLPERIGRLSKLERLDAGENLLYRVPCSMGDLSRLNRLDLSRNRLVSLPAELARLQMLDELYLDDNPLEEIPAELGDLPRLRVFSARNSVVPEELRGVDLGRLRSLAEGHLEGRWSGGPEVGKQYFEFPPFVSEFFLAAGGLTGVLGIVELYYRRFHQECSVVLQFPGGTRVSLANLSRSRAIKIAREHEILLQEGRAVVEMGEARNAAAQKKKTEFAVEALTQVPQVEMGTRTREADPNRTSWKFDVFLSYNRTDKDLVVELVERLKGRDVRVWLDEWELIPGRPWQEALEEIVSGAKAAAVLVGRNGLGPWQRREMRAALEEFVERESPVIPVLLPGAPTSPELPVFLGHFTWVDLRKGFSSEGMDRLEWGITGSKPKFLGQVPAR